ncbi:MAG: fibronectin type III domain-containing protein [Bacteroidetes bacterium]|nr:fibronectin type III domain-containing protein [Bacteroidota bacterium]
MGPGGFHSSWSESGSFRTFNIPDATTRLKAQASGENTINLSWSAPTDNGGVEINGYRIDVSPNGRSDWEIQRGFSSSTTYSDKFLSPGVTRYYRVSAVSVLVLVKHPISRRQRLLGRLWLQQFLPTCLQLPSVVIRSNFLGIHHQMMGERKSPDTG